MRLCRSIARVCQLEVTDPLQVLSSQPEEGKDTEDWPETLKLVQTLELGTLVAIEALW